MIGLVGFTVFPINTSLDQSWSACKDRLKKSFSVDFFSVVYNDYTIEFCINSLSRLNSENVSLKNYFVGSCHEDHKFSVEDHGALLEINDNNIFIQNDWLASIPIFYNLEHKFFSTFYNAVAFNVCSIQPDENFDFEGLAGYFKYGYSVFEKTPLKGVNFLAPLSTVQIVGETININVACDSDLTLESSTSSSEVLNSINEDLHQKLLYSKDEIVLPLSGGLDSRLLAGVLKDRHPHTFTYGGSKHNFEPVYAEVIAKKIGLQWNYVNLDSFYSYSESWCDFYGLSTHAHGMYQMEFYQKVKDLTPNRYVVSGIFADIWAGNSKVSINSEDDIVSLGYSHGLSLSDRMNFDMSPIKKLEYDYYQFLKSSKNENFDALHRIRIKIILIGYLLSLPRLMGFVPITPFLNKKIAVLMLNLQDNERDGRIWQKKIIEQMGLVIPKHISLLKSSFVNGMDATAMLNYDFSGIIQDFNDQKISQVGLEKKTVNNLDAINDISYLKKTNLYLSSTRGVQRLITKAGLRSELLSQLRDVQCIYPLSHFIKNTNCHFKT